VLSPWGRRACAEGGVGGGGVGGGGDAMCDGGGSVRSGWGAGGGEGDVGVVGCGWPETGVRVLSGGTPDPTSRGCPFFSPCSCSCSALCGWLGVGMGITKSLIRWAVRVWTLV